MSDTAKPKVRKRFSWSLLITIVLVGVVFWQRLAIYDYIQLYDYQPAGEISQLADDDTMTGYARHMFYVNHPDLKDRSSFGDFCPAGTEQSVVLGCYISDQKGIYILRVDNTELAGIEQVTAAHEMLHAAYQRLSANDKKHVDAMLEDYFNNQLDDNDIKQTIQSYKQTEPTELVNEMHSIIGTEVPNLPPQLESYYKKYFTDRGRVTGYYSKYEAAFTSRQKQIKQYDSQLQTMKASIDSQTKQLTGQGQDLQVRSRQLDSEQPSGDNQSYNQQVIAYNRDVAAYQRDYAALNRQIDTYNQLIETRNTIVLEEQQLVTAISAPAKVR